MPRVQRERRCAAELSRGQSCHQTLDPLASHLYGFQRMGPNQIRKGYDKSDPTRCIDEERGTCYPVVEYLDSRIDWDTHDTIADQGTSHEQLFSELLKISRRLEETGLLARTTVAVLSEFTRTPKLNKQPEPGKDHWPLTSALVFGGKIKAGRYGTTDDSLGAVPVRMDDGTASDSGRLLQFDNFAAGLLTHFGIPYTPSIPSTVEPFRGPFA